MSDPAANTAATGEQLNLKVKSQVPLPPCRTARRSSSRSRAAPSSRSSWMPTASART